MKKGQTIETEIEKTNKQRKNKITHAWSNINCGSMWILEEHLKDDAPDHCRNKTQAAQQRGRRQLLYRRVGGANETQVSDIC